MKMRIERIELPVVPAEELFELELGPSATIIHGEFFPVERGGGAGTFAPCIWVEKNTEEEAKLRKFCFLPGSKDIEKRPHPGNLLVLQHRRSFGYVQDAPSIIQGAPTRIQAFMFHLYEMVEV